ncbi:hypothetical protein N9Z65_00205 [bacterium]|nr:hypothetical protein [bacterium]
MPVNTSKTKLRSYFDIENNVEYINLAPYLEHSHQEYNYFIVDSELSKIKQREKQKLGIHFILQEILLVCKMSKRKKCFYYQVNPQFKEEHKLVQRIFKVLPSQIIYNKLDYDDFLLAQREYEVFTPIDTSKISWKRFKSFLIKNGLTAIEDKFTKDINVKLSLIH